MEWRVKAIRGATTASENTEDAIASAVTELLQELEYRNRIDPDRIVSVIFTATKDLDAVFPAAIARRLYPNWQDVALMDVQQMHVEGSLPRCIRFLIHAHLPADAKIYHPTLRGASNLRPDRSLVS
ncbi:MAG: chorismate mutase [Chamaesiphon sp. CSU_1_12]|nr:chorismate mutase [Chamaesiphon sp. CSU_1_12]